MKMYYSVYPLTIALATILAATGCQHRPAKVTPLPGSQPEVGDQAPTTISPGPAINPTEPPVSLPITPGPIAQGSPDAFANMSEDRSALAADTIHFAFDSSTIRGLEGSKLQDVAKALSADPNTKLTIEGNCDERGTEEYNRALGERRADAAREALAKLGIDASRMRTISYGKDKPADPGHDDAAWKANRRDDFVLLHPKTGA